MASAGDSICSLSAGELGRRILRREVSCVEAARAYLDRIDALNPTFHAYITVTPQIALAQARDLDQRLARGFYLGPLHGVPYGVKDQLFTAGVRTTDGSRVHQDFIPQHDATVVSRLNSAGGVFLGKLNMTQFALGADDEFVFGNVPNPWARDRHPGSSSAGAGVAAAACLAAIAIGEDTSGSIRGPAAWCGVSGLRPTWGLISRFGMFEASWSMDTAGPICRTVEDCALVLQAVAGRDPRDPFTWKEKPPRYREALTGDVKGLRIGIVREYFSDASLADEVRHAVTAALTRLEGLGAQVRDVSIPSVAHSGVVSAVIMLAEMAYLHRKTLSQRPDLYGGPTRRFLLSGAAVPIGLYQKALRLRQQVRGEVLAALRQADVLVWPTASIAAPVARFGGQLTTVEEAVANLGPRRNFHAPVNLAGVPALSVPCGFTRGGLPVGMLIVGGPLDDATVLRVGDAYQRSTRWHHRRPPV